MRYVYGPLNSRRLGYSLGLSLTSYKICDFDCIYCQLGKTRELKKERQEYSKIEDVFDEFKSWLEKNPQEAKKINYVTISGSGEPTLNTRIAELIGKIKKIIPCPVAVITNASLFDDPHVRAGLNEADLVVPSLDSVIPEVFNKIDRPHPDIKIEGIIEGLVAFRKEFRGKIWLEVMILRCINDELAQIRKLKEAVDRINPDKVQINSSVRATSELGILPADKKRLEKICEILGDKCEII
jgi:wyosine [tRNA(Phe)-imidazoG37] synthetase (radical SAM superfamily)